jgi:hypothetical protein
LPYHDEFANTFSCWLLPMLPQEQALVKLTSTNKENPRSTGPIYQVCMKHGPRHGYSRKQEAQDGAPAFDARERTESGNQKISEQEWEGGVHGIEIALI